MNTNTNETRRFPYLEDGPGYSPDGGSFWRKGNQIFWSSGDITDLKDGLMFRFMKASGEDYSEWSDQKREQVKMEYAEKRRKYKKQMEDHKEWVDFHVDAAESKLTDDEKTALRECYRGY